MLKILQVRFQQYVNQELPDIHARYRKGRGSRDHIVNICWTIPKAREFQKTSTFTSLTTQKPLAVWITTNCGKVLKWWKYQTTLSASWETCIQVKKQVRTLPGTIDWFQIGKEYVKAAHCHPTYLSCMQCTSHEMLGWMKHKLESKLPGEKTITSDTQMIPPLRNKTKKN